MRLIKPSYEIWQQPSGLEGIYKQIERAGRVCYRSEDKITEDSAKPFVDRMIKSQHLAITEHGTIYLHLTMASRDQYFKYCTNKYSKANSTGSAEHGTWEGFVTTNMRVLIENGWMDDMEYLCDPTEHHERRVTVKYVASIHFYKDCTRHRVFSWAIESTRYCNYIKDKFGHSVSFIYPCWLKEEEVEEFEQDLKTIEKIYFKWIEKGWQAQQAATFLPQATKAEVIMTGFVSDWKHFFRLRSRIAETGKPHPQAQELADPLMDEFVKRGIMETLL